MRRLFSRALRRIARIVRPTRRPVEIDEFPLWMSYAIPGWLDPGNRFCFEYAIERLPSDAPIVEIGSFCGLSTNFLAYYLRKHGRNNRLFNTDPWDFEGSRKGPLGAHSPREQDEYRRFVIESFERNARFFSPNLPFAIEKTSQAFFEAWRRGERTSDLFGREVALGGPIAFAYIDGNHTYDAALADFVGCDEFLQGGGFLLFDDSHTDWGVTGVMRDVKNSRRYELVMRNPNHLFQKRR
jgi:hypothetical protein